MGEVALVQYRADRRQIAIRHEDLRERGIARDQCAIGRNIVGEFARDWKTVFRIIDGRLERGRKRDRAELVQRITPRAHRAGHRH